MFTDTEALLGALGDVAFFPGERDALRDIQSVGGDLSEETRRHNQGVYLVNQALRLSSMAWCNGFQVLPPEVWKVLASNLPKMPTTIDLLRSMIRYGVGITAMEPDVGGRWWVPQAIVLMAQHRTGETLEVAGERWAMSPRYPVPQVQVLVEGLNLEEREARLLVVSSTLFRARVVEGPMWPEDMFAREQQRPLLVEELGLLAIQDPMAAMRNLLGSFGDPLAGPMQQVGIAAMHNAAWMQEQAVRWDGRLAFNVIGPALLAFEDTIVLKTGWLLQVLRGLGIECPGLHMTGIVDAEVHLGRQGGGRVIEVEGYPWLVVPAHLGNPIRALPIDWSDVAKGE